MEQTPFTAATSSGELDGWVTGDGPPVLVLHGGPGLGFEDMDDVVAEIAGRHRVATFQQRGLSPSAAEGLWDEIVARLPDLEAALPSIAVPVGVLVGEGSPMPTTAGTDTADRIPGGWSYVVPGAGHVVWIESPGAVLTALDRLIGHLG